MHTQNVKSTQYFHIFQHFKNNVIDVHFQTLAKQGEKEPTNTQNTVACRKQCRTQEPPYKYQGFSQQKEKGLVFVVLKATYTAFQHT